MQELRGETWEYPSKVMCFVDGQLIGDEKMLLQWAYDVWDYKDFKPTALYTAITEDFIYKYMKNKQVGSWFSEGKDLGPGRTIILLWGWLMRPLIP